MERADRLDEGGTKSGQMRRFAAFSGTGGGFWFLKGASAYEYNCLDELFPYVFGSDISDVKITASFTMDIDFNGPVFLFLGGSTRTPQILGIGGTSPLAQDRAWVGVMYIYPSRSA